MGKPRGTTPVIQMTPFRTHDLVREIEYELGGELTAYEQYQIQCEAKKLFPNGIIPEEKICDVVGIVMALVF